MEKDKLIDLINKKIENAENDIERIRGEIKKNDSINADLLETVTLIRGEIRAYMDILLLLAWEKVN